MGGSCSTRVGRKCTQYFLTMNNFFMFTMGQKSVWGAVSGGHCNEH
jgi:hypothetical protein